MVKTKLLSWVGAGLLAAVTIPGVGMAKSIRSAHYNAAAPTITRVAATSATSSKKTTVTSAKHATKVQARTVRKAPVKKLTTKKKLVSRHPARSSARRTTKATAHRSTRAATKRLSTRHSHVGARKLNSRPATHRKLIKK